MTVKTTYWLIGPDNTFAQVEGADRRDEATTQGWTVTDEPSGPDRVWMQHDVTGAISLFPHAVLEPWQARGWQLVVPPTQPTGQGVMVVLPERGEQAPPTPAAVATPTTPIETPAAATPTTDKPQRTEKEK